MAVAGESNKMSIDQIHGRPEGYTILKYTVEQMQKQIKDLQERIEALEGGKCETN